MPALKGYGKKKKVAKVLKKVNTFLKKNKLISKGSKILVKVAPKKHKAKIRAAGDVAELLGYGVGLPGGRGCRGAGLKLAGQGNKRKRVVKRKKVRKKK